VILFYFGADDTWNNLNKRGFYRRNTCLLKAFKDSDQIEKIYLVHRTIRPKLLKQMKNKPDSGDKVQDIFFATIFSEKKVFNSINRWLIQKQLLRQTGYRSKPDDVLFAYWPRGFLAWKATGIAGKLIFDTDHNIIGDPHLDSGQGEERETLFDEILQKADVILSGARSMLNWLRDRGFNQIHRIRNGVDRERFTGFNRENKISGKMPVIGYMGTLSLWIDWDLLFNLVSRNPTWSFHFIGAPYKSQQYEKLEVLPNVVFFGQQSPSEVVKLMQEFDVGLALYQKHPALDVDSMKIFEYLAAGTPVVSTRFHDFLEEDFMGLLYLADSVEELEQGIREALVSTSAKENIRKEFLKGCEWSKRAEEVIQIIKK